MSTTVMLLDQLAELRMMIDRGNPVHVEAEVAFSAMVRELTRDGDAGSKRPLPCNKPTPAAPPGMRGSINGPEHHGACDDRRAADPLEVRLMPGTAEAYDPFALS